MIVTVQIDSLRWLEPVIQQDQQNIQQDRKDVKHNGNNSKLYVVLEVTKNKDTTTYIIKGSDTKPAFSLAETTAKIMALKKAEALFVLTGGDSSKDVSEKDLEIFRKALNRLNNEVQKHSSHHNPLTRFFVRWLSSEELPQPLCGKFAYNHKPDGTKRQPCEVSYYETYRSKPTNFPLLTSQIDLFVESGTYLHPSYSKGTRVDCLKETITNLVLIILQPAISAMALCTNWNDLSRPNRCWAIIDIPVGILFGSVISAANAIRFLAAAIITPKIVYEQL